MKSIFDPQHNQELIDRIEKLDATKPALWGKMNAGQMLAHCQVPMQVTLGDIKLKRNIVGYLFGNIAKKKLMSDAPFDKNLPTFKQAKIKNERDFTSEREKLAGYIRRIATQGPAGVTKEDHPFFGKLTIEEWDKLNYKHLDHHLQQFGV